MRLSPKGITLRTITDFDWEGQPSTYTDSKYTAIVNNDTDTIAKYVRTVNGNDTSLLGTGFEDTWIFQLKNYWGSKPDANDIKVIYDSNTFDVRYIDYDDRLKFLTLFCRPQTGLV
jgi:hypothetical protein